jgi:cytochrome c551/c552
MIRLIISLSFLVAIAASAEEDAKLAKSMGCMICHDVSRPKAGPSFSKIAERYRGQEDAAAKLADMLAKGTGDHVKIKGSEADLRQVMAYILATP